MLVYVFKASCSVISSLCFVSFFRVLFSSLQVLLLSLCLSVWPGSLNQAYAAAMESVCVCVFCYFIYFAVYLFMVCRFYGHCDWLYTYLPGGPFLPGLPQAPAFPPYVADLGSWCILAQQPIAGAGIFISLFSWNPSLPLALCILGRFSEFVATGRHGGEGGGSISGC